MRRSVLKLGLGSEWKRSATRNETWPAVPRRRSTQGRTYLIGDYVQMCIGAIGGHGTYWYKGGLERRRLPVSLTLFV